MTCFASDSLQCVTVNTGYLIVGPLWIIVHSRLFWSPQRLLAPHIVYRRTKLRKSQERRLEKGSEGKIMFSDTFDVKFISPQIARKISVMGGSVGENICVLSAKNQSVKILDTILKLFIKYFLFIFCH